MMQEIYIMDCLSSLLLHLLIKYDAHLKVLWGMMVTVEEEVCAIDRLSPTGNLHAEKLWPAESEGGRGGFCSVQVAFAIFTLLRGLQVLRYCHYWAQTNGFTWSYINKGSAYSTLNLINHNTVCFVSYLAKMLGTFSQLYSINNSYSKFS